MKTKEVTYYTNNCDDDFFEELRQHLREQHGETEGVPREPTEQEVWDEWNFTDSNNWELFMEEVDAWDKKKDCRVIIFGTAGLWTGRQAGGKVLPSLRQAVEKSWSRSIDYFTVTRQENGVMLIKATHHDGTNYWEVKALTGHGELWYKNNKNNWDVSEKDMHNHLLNVRCYTRNIKLW